MHAPDPLTLAALLTLIAAAAAAGFADRPSRPTAPRWPYPAAIIAIAAVNIGLTVVAIGRSAPTTGTILLVSALLLIYAGQRRARAANLRRPPRPRSAAPTMITASSTALGPRTPAVARSYGGPAQRRTPRRLDGEAQLGHRGYPYVVGLRLSAERPWRKGHPQPNMITRG